MAVWGNDSFDVGAAGGWGDVSYSATEAPSEASKSVDKVVVPVSVEDLNRNVNQNEEKLTFNKTSFSTVRIAGVVKDAKEQDGGQSVEYKIADDAESNERFLVIHYRGVNPNDISSELFVEGTVVMVVGKLRNFDNRLAIVAFDVREIDDKRELEAYHLEAKLAKLFYTKDVIEVIKSNSSLFENTMLRRNLEGAQTNSGNKNGNTGTTWNQNGINSAITSQFNGAVENTKGLSGQKGAIYKYLSGLNSMEGASTEEIKKNIPKNLFNQRTFATDFESLLSEGHIYSTIDDDHYTAN
uniref:RPA_C domain-containing protein n=1 Tax=Syphacia muris TaxID=451379 RepID=A0A0N5AUF3_9BILA